MNRLWKSVNTTKIRPQAVPVSSVAPQDLNAVIDLLVRDALFRRSMIHEVLKDLDKANFVTIRMVEEKLCLLPPPSPSVFTAELSGGFTCFCTLKRGMFKPDVPMVLLQERVKFLDERQANKAI